MKVFNRDQNQNNILDLYQEKLFCDIVIHWKNEEYYAHRLILQNYSSYFASIFEKYKDTTDIPRVDHVTIEINPQNMFSKVIDILYSKPVQITVTNVVSIYKICCYYGIYSFIENIKNFITKSLSSNTVLHYVTEFISYDMIEESKIIVPFLSQTFLQIINSKTPQQEAELEQLLKCVSNGILFSYVIMADPLNSALSEYDKFCLVDKYSKIKRFSEAESIELASLFNWEDPNSLNYFVEFSCDWLPLNISRKCYSTLLSRRKNIIKVFESISENVKEQASRLHCFLWVDICSKASIVPDHPSINILDFISSLGNSNVEFDPIKYSYLLCNVHQTTYDIFHPIQSIFKNDQSYAIIESCDDHPASISLSFGNHTVITANSFTISCDIEKNTRKPNNITTKQYYTVPNQLLVKTFLNGTISNEFEISSDQNKIYQLEKVPNSFDSILVSIPPSLSDIYKILRIRNISIVGTVDTQ
ncbi:BTB/POZ domain containing protein [Trichomonas vaginalis G3]|uniref:BTB/POZ domain containing protein n=1 Tax=Trichomonas vaginalis (strain ATCC PRA-98 / G3) TaxID=412133 RepID=A2EXE3_TRIV3|nr:HL07962P-related family [Trichomonas vaginalis G3]EAY02692.1 BTB/POZ domain containing protein [Trichomonas vaginalis G3]KAI5507601.1 HL07962P-related family [Trichomonas vaginalis G3]|eukprot:XP_001314915.1 BTB/POZ domain containing protein [Trichomonas vaginalis G3]